MADHGTSRDYSCYTVLRALNACSTRQTQTAAYFEYMRCSHARFEVVGDDSVRESGGYRFGTPTRRAPQSSFIPTLVRSAARQ